MTHRVEVYDPALCCSSGVCGPSVDPNLVRVARDLAWLRHQPGIGVERYNLGQQPHAFAENPLVREALQAGPDVLPLVLVDGEVVARGAYPTREELCALVGIEPPKAATSSDPVQP